MSHRFANFVCVCRPLKTLLFCLLALGTAAIPAGAQSSSDPVYVFHTSLGDISVQLFPDVTPKTVANFLSYVNAGVYNNSLFHRSVPGFIVQGGGYQIVSGPKIAAIPTNAPVVNEFHLSNTRGTLAMAKSGGDPNSATDEWFFNESDSNASNLDNQNGGFTVFGKVTDSASLAVMDKLAAVPVPSPPPLSAPLDQIPLINYQPSAGVLVSNLVTVSSITRASGPHILWSNAGGGASLWTLNADGTYTHHDFGPFSGWTVKAVADGPDGLAHVLWNNTNGSIALWSVGVDGTPAGITFGPYTGLAASALAVGPDNHTHVLWNYQNGGIALWDLAPGAAPTGVAYGPFSGYSAKALAVGPDNHAHVLWNVQGGGIALWDIAPGAAPTGTAYSVPAAYTALALSAGPDNHVHVLWNHAPDNQIALWDVDTSGHPIGTAFGPYAGYTASSLTVGSDNHTHVLWNVQSGGNTVWDIAPGLAPTSILYHPDAGWTALAISAAP